MDRVLPGLAALALGLLTVGCAVTSGTARKNSTPPVRGQRVLVMDPDVELYVLTAGGLLEPNAEWTGAARGHVAAALIEELRSKGLDPTSYAPPQDPDQKHAHDQLLKLHDVVAGVAIGGGMMLPTKKGGLDWSLGDGVRTLREAHGVDYGLFVVLRDSYASGGRHAMGIGVAILSLGTVAMPMGQQRGAASLVDLRTGNIVWVNNLFSSVGDLRTADSARKAVKSLMGSLPQ
jgi:hypothetical protein